MSIDPGFFGRNPEKLGKLRFLSEMKKRSVPVRPLWAFLLRDHHESMCGNCVVWRVSNTGAYRVRVDYNSSNKSSSIFAASYTPLFLIILGFQMQWHSGFPVVTFS